MGTKQNHIEKRHSGVLLHGDGGWLQIMMMYYIFQKATRKDFECFYHKEMINV
jgi:hypothetical protein